MVPYLLERQQRGSAKSDGGSAFREFRRDVLVGNPRDPLIGFPIIHLCPVSTANRELSRPD
jgi:hypothetical protein